MGSFLALAPLILQILTQLPSLIKAAEEAFSSKPSSGAAKKEFVMLTVDAGLNAASQLGVDELKDEKVKETIKEVVSKTTDATVAVLNASGVLKPEPQS